MITGHTDAIQLYNTWFAENYLGLQRYCKRYKIEEDILNTVYINVAERIAKSGFTESYYTTYVKRSIRNLSINEKKKDNNKYFVDFDNEDYTNCVEDKLQYANDCEKDTQLYREEIMMLSKKIFEYLMTEKKIDDESLFVFRCYFLMAGRMTYAKLHTMTGIDKSRCTRIISSTKKDIRNNFLTWLKNDERRSTGSNE